MADTLREALHGLLARHGDGSDERYWAEWDTARDALSTIPAEPPAQPAPIPSFRDDDLVRIGRGNISTTMYAREWFDAAVREGATQSEGTCPNPNCGSNETYTEKRCAYCGAAFERGRQQGMRQERALWELSAIGQEIEASTIPAEPGQPSSLGHSTESDSTFPDAAGDE